VAGARRQALAEWQQLAGEIPVEWALANREEIQEASRLRREVDVLGSISTTAPDVSNDLTGELAHVLVTQGRDEAAVDELEQAGDIYGDPTWKSTRARVLARRGETEEAVTLAREAIASMVDGDNITARAERLVDLAEVLRAHGNLADAAAALTEAVGLHEEKGNAVPAERCRDLLATIEAGGPAATAG